MVARAVLRGTLALLGSLLLVSFATRVRAQCVGDCGEDGEVTISDLILGVNIALGNQPVSACPAFANEDDEVTIAQLIQGVNNALNGCPTPAATPTDTASAATPTATASEMPFTATATSTATDTPPATDTAMPSATATATIPPSTATPTDTVPPTATPPATATPSDTATPPATVTATATSAPSVTPTETVVPPGDQIAGRAAFISTGLGAIQTVVAALVTAATNDSEALVYGVPQGLPPPIAVHQCPISGETTQSCTEMGSGSGKTISLVLGADSCVAPGPLGGTGEFDGTISIDSTASMDNSCSSPLVFFGGAYEVSNLTVVLRDAMMGLALTVSAGLNGDLSITADDGSCLMTTLSLSLNGAMTSVLPDGTGVEVDFFATDVVMSNITYNADCVPLAYTLKFNGDAGFTPMSAALLEIAAPLVSGVPVEQPFDVTFVNFTLTQDATMSPVMVEMGGTLSSTCFGGEQLILDTLTPMAVAAGELCPSAGQIDVTGSGDGKASVVYDNGMVTVTPEGGQAAIYPSCLASELMMCVPQ